MSPWIGKFGVVMLALALAGCVSTTAVLQDWVGAPESELLRRWGEPTRILETGDGVKVLEYAEERFITVPDRLSNLRLRYRSSTLEYVEHRFWCRTLWTLFYFSGEGTIVTFRFQGNACDPIKRRSVKIK